MAILQANKQLPLCGVMARVFRQPRYLLLATLAGGGLLLSLSLFPHRALIMAILTSSGTSLAQKWEAITAIAVLLGSNMSNVSMMLTVIVAVLFGIQSALLLYYIRRRQTSASRDVKMHLTSVGGFVAALFGIGCAACGSVIVTALLGLFGASGLLLLLPLHGFEFGVVGVGLLLVSIFYLARRIDDPLVCRVDL